MSFMEAKKKWSKTQWLESVHEGKIQCIPPGISEKWKKHREKQKKWNMQQCHCRHHCATQSQLLKTIGIDTWYSIVWTHRMPWSPRIRENMAKILAMRSLWCTIISSIDTRAAWLYVCILFQRLNESHRLAANKNWLLELLFWCYKCEIGDHWT